jgi:hypothetical protein
VVKLVLELKIVKDGCDTDEGEKNSAKDPHVPQGEANPYL